MEKEKKSIVKKWWFWLIVIIIILVAASGGSEENVVIETAEINNTIVKENITFLKNTNGKDFYNILCDVADISKKEPQEMGDSIIYESADTNYSVEIEANKNTQEIAYIRMMVLQKEDYENFFLAISRLNYDGSDSEKIYSWVHENLGEDTSMELGNVKFVLTVGTSGKPILEVKTNGYDEYSKEQMNKLLN